MIPFRRTYWLSAIILTLSIWNKEAYTLSLNTSEKVIEGNPVQWVQRADSCEKLSFEHLTTNPTKARDIAREGLVFAQKSGNQLSKARLTRILGSTFTMLGKYDSAEIYLFKARELASSLKNSDLNGSVNLSLGTLFTRQKRTDDAMACFFAALNVFEQNGDRKSLCRTLGNIAALFMYQHNYNEAEKYYREAEKLSTKLNDHGGLGQAYSGLVKIYQERKLTGKALEYAQAAVREFDISGEKAYESLAYKEVATIYLERNNLNLAEENGLKSLALAREAGISRYVANALSVLAQVHFRNGRYQQSIDYSFETLKADSTDSETKSTMFANLMKCYSSLGKPELAIGYFVRYQKEIDSQVNEKYQQSISEMEVRYQTAKKELAIQTLQAKKRVVTLAAISAVLLLLTVVIALIFRGKNISAKKKIAEQKIVQLEKEKQLIATQSLLAGEEIERTRLAGDLHDGLGGLLTGVKLKLSSMKENSIITSENLTHFNHALDLLDTSIAEMRRVAHNLMPETLMHYGLRTALADFVRQVSPEGTPQIRLSTFGNDLRFGKELEITVYRITQELVTNALKHAQAQLIDLQLFTEPERICVQVIDNGIGFNTSETNGKAGKGLQNINDRVTAFNGRFEILSEPGKGTESTLEFLIS